MDAIDTIDTITHSAHADTAFDLLHEMFNNPDSMLQRMHDMHERPAMDALVDAGIVARCPERGQYHLTTTGAAQYKASLDALLF